MTDHKFTDDEIIKALELCFTPKGTSYTCAKCPFHKIVLCKIERDRAALDLLHRQKAQIIKEQNKNSKLRNESNHLKAEIDDLKRDTIPKLRWSLDRANKYGAEADRENRVLKMEIANARAKAIKEFAEKIKEQDGNYFITEWYESGDVCYAFDQEKFETFIDNLVKEMKEGNNE